MIWSGSVFILLCAVLVVHIYLVTKSHKSKGDTRQLSRIDFKQPVDATEASKIRSFVKHLNGVQSTFFNVDNGILVYTYLRDKQTSENVYNQLIKFGNYKAERFKVDESAPTGCPIIDKKSFTYTVSSYIQKLFN